MLSIGLGQEQQFTLILQTLQQLRDVYGDSVDKIVQGNTSNLIFLKSTDDSMLDTLQKMSGTTHRVRISGKTITRDMERIWLQNEGKVSYNMTTSNDEPVITYNDMAFIGKKPGNSIVFRAGDSPIWNRNNMSLPMSWRLHMNDIKQPGKEYTFQTVPTLSSAKEFDVRQNQPDFMKMLEKRMEQALFTQNATELYKDAYDYDDYQISQLDPDIYADDILKIVNDFIKQDKGGNSSLETERELNEYIEDNTEQLRETEVANNTLEAHSKAQYAGEMLSKNDLVSLTGHVNHQYDREIIRAYLDVRGDMENDRTFFKVDDNGSLCGNDGKIYIRKRSESDTLRYVNEQAKNENSKVFSESGIDQAELNQYGTHEVTDDFIRFLVSFEHWDFANNRFDDAMRRVMQN